MKKKVEAIFRKKIIAGLFTHQLLMEAIKYHSEGLREYVHDSGVAYRPSLLVVIPFSTMNSLRNFQVLQHCPFAFGEPLAFQPTTGGDC